LGEKIFELPYDYELPFVDITVQLPTNKEIHYTMIFHSLMLMMVFHEIGSRKNLDSELNIFDNILNNKTFIVVILATLAIQFSFVQYGSSIVRCVPLNTRQHIICLLVGFSVLVITYIVKFISPKYFEGC
jgi:hypothetical protein